MSKEKEIIESRLRSVINETVIFINEETALAEGQQKLLDKIKEAKKEGRKFEEVSKEFKAFDEGHFGLEILRQTISLKVSGIVELKTLCEMLGISPQMDESSKNFLKNVMQGSLSLYVIKDKKVQFSDSPEAQMYISAMQHRADQSQDQMKTAYESLEV